MKTCERTLRLCGHRHCYYDKHSHCRTGSQVPTVKLQGEWLRQFGFEIGDYIRIASDGLGSIIIRNMGNPDRHQGGGT